MPAAIECGLVDDSLGVFSPRPVLYKLELYNDKTLIGGGLRDQSLVTIEGGLNIRRPGWHNVDQAMTTSRFWPRPLPAMTKPSGKGHGMAIFDLIFTFNPPIQWKIFSLDHDERPMDCRRSSAIKKQWQIAMPSRWEANWNSIFGHDVPAMQKNYAIREMCGSCESEFLVCF
jgi:hypothetical protein